MRAVRYEDIRGANVISDCITLLKVVINRY